MSDWETVTILRKKPPKPSQLKSEQAVAQARRQGVPVETAQKWGGGQNKQHATGKNTAKLDRETEELKHETVPLDVGKLIQQGRQAKGWSQKELATRIVFLEFLKSTKSICYKKPIADTESAGNKRVNEKPQVVQEYENGRGIPNQTVLSKLERVLGMKLRGKDRGRAVTAPPAKK